MRDVTGPGSALDVGADHRARMLRERAEAKERRENALIEQRSESNTPEARIRIWERLHEIDLPKDPEHRLIALIAKQTSLSVADVHEAQRLRTMPAVSELHLPE